MPFLLRNLTLDVNETEDKLPGRLRQRFALSSDDITSVDVVRKGVDARKKSRIRFVYTVQFTVRDERAFQKKHLPHPDLEIVATTPQASFPVTPQTRKIVVVGAGPAGLFAALRLSEYGLACTLLERGRKVEERVRDVELFWEQGILNEESNVQFGEGGAGTFSDGKLTTRIRDDNIRYVLTRLVDFGAPEDILFLAKPHIGTDRLRQVVINLRRHLQAKGVEVRFNERLTGFATATGRLSAVITDDTAELPCDTLILAPGHSARDTYRMLAREGVRLEMKSFAVGVRVEHPQELINSIQYGTKEHPHLPPADYALTYNNPADGHSAYSFCMCPGGVVVAAASETGGVVTNGMSGYRRLAPFANSALVVTVTARDLTGTGPLAGAEFQRQLEQAAFAAGGGNYRAPAQNLLAFLGEKKQGEPRSSYRPGITEYDLHALLPPFVTQTLREGLRSFDKKMRGFITREATLIGVETRTSAPVRIVRGDDLQSITLPGLYPAGEGAGYAGGIMSAAIDGIRVADAIAREMRGSNEVTHQPQPSEGAAFAKDIC